MSKIIGPLYRLETCYFYREDPAKGGRAEVGILLNEGDLGILDKWGNKVEVVWTHERTERFCVELDVSHLEAVL